MQDANLARLDQLLGLDWRSYYRFIYERPALVPYVYLGYAMITWPTFGVPIVLGLTKHYFRLQQFTFACMLTVVATALISSLLPAVGTYYEYGISADLPAFRASGYLIQLHELPLVRDGSLRVLDFKNLGGIITFPSFHAAAAVLALWAFWGVWWMRPLALIANVGMLLATPLVGGHYFVDVFAGIALAMLAIAAARRIGGRSTRPVTRIIAPTPAAA
jgi:membrane-associated phospholipid phosphatase